MFKLDACGKRVLFISDTHIPYHITYIKTLLGNKFSKHSGGLKENGDPILFPYKGP